MPISYRISAPENLVSTKAEGTLTDADIIDHKERLSEDQDFVPGMLELSDVRDVTTLEVTPEGIQRFTAFDKDNSESARGHRLAIVASEDFIFGMARMYQIQAPEGHETGVSVFRTIEEARSWLGLDGASPAP